MKSTLIAAASAAVALAVAAPAFAQSADGLGHVTPYINLGYSYTNPAQGKFHLVDGRIGAKFGRYIGVEGEFGYGLNSQTFSGVKFKPTTSYAGYGVAFLPLAPSFDLFARVGYGHSNVRGTVGTVSATVGEDSVNYGGGAQYFWTPNDGTRLEYTRYDFRNAAGSENVFGVSWVHRFR